MSSQQSSLNNTSRITREFYGSDGSNSCPKATYNFSMAMKLNTQILGNVFCFVFFFLYSLAIYTARTLSATTSSNFYFTGIYFLSNCLSFCTGCNNNPRGKLVCDYTIKYYITVQYKYITDTKWQS